MCSESFGTEVDGGGSAKNKINRRRDRETGLLACMLRLSWKLFKVERAVSPGEPPSIPLRDHYVSSLFPFLFLFSIRSFVFVLVRLRGNPEANSVNLDYRLGRGTCDLSVFRRPFSSFLSFLVYEGWDVDTSECSF